MEGPQADERNQLATTTKSSFPRYRTAQRPVPKSAQDIIEDFDSTSEHTLVTATTHLQAMQKLLADSSENIDAENLLAVGTTFLDKTLPQNLSQSAATELVDEGTHKQRIKDYVVSYMKLTGDLMNLSTTNAWIELIKNFNGSNYLKPTSLLPKLDDVIDFSVQSLDYGDFEETRAGDKTSATALLFESSEIKLNARLLFQNQSLRLTTYGEKSSRRKRSYYHQTDSGDLTIISAVYKTLPDLLNAILAKVYPHNNNDEKYPQSLCTVDGDLCVSRNFCFRSGLSVSDSLCELLFEKSPASAEEGRNISYLRWSSKIVFPPGSKVISASAYDKSTNKKSMPVSFDVHYSSDNFKVDAVQKCVFYNTTTHAWSDYGCELLNFRENSYSCYCNHTTNFAVMLMLPINCHNESRDSKFAGEENLACSSVLKVLTVVAGIVSVIFLLIGIIFLGLGRRNSEINEERNSIHLCLALSMLLLHLVLFLEELTVKFVYPIPDLLCILLAFTGHYSLLCNFTWMTLEGSLLYLSVVKGFLEGKTLGKWNHVVGWGLPCLIAGSTMAVGLATNGLYLTNSVPLNATLKRNNEIEGFHVCLLSSHLRWSSVALVLVSMLINTWIAWAVIRVIFRLTRENRHYVPSDQTKTLYEVNVKAIKKSLIAFCKLFPILGLPWILALVASFLPPTSACRLLIVHSVVNGVQGAFFFFVVVYTRDYKEILLLACGRMRHNVH
ncbi:uncharacterized protein LOC143470377 isoform X3 [Clavelina lepadiformis]|uniref:uncharacterized protein LOC143470377 isoform X3 n=1 Tax=Clavelina lepadiformis TaxID=159417 RepID=UPI0040428BF2